MQTAGSSDRELALTTLIDLFVQILFVFVMILAVKANNNGANGGFEIDKPWQRLAEFLGLPTNGKNVVANAAIEKIKALEKENKDLLTRLALNTKLKSADGRAPGKPRCKAQEQILPPVITLVLKADSTIVALPYTGWRSVTKQFNIDDKSMFGFRLSSTDFLDRFAPVFALSEKLDCRYSAIISYERSIGGEMLDKNSSLVQRYFYRVGP